MAPCGPPQRPSNAPKRGWDETWATPTSASSPPRATRPSCSGQPPHRSSCTASSAPRPRQAPRILVTHTITPANDQPWFTVWKEQGDAIYERYEDCKITTCNIEFTAGGDIAASLNIFGLDFTRLDACGRAVAAAAGVHDQAVPFRVPGAKYTIAGADDKTLASGNFNIEATQNPIQTTEISYSYLIPGQRAITFGYEGVFTDVSRYAQVYYGAPAGTDPTLTVFEAPISLQWGKDGVPTAGDKRIKLTMTRALFTEAAPSMDPGGAPMMISVAGAGRATPIASAEVVNALVDYPVAA